MPARAFIVVDLGFGDAGKGTLTDYLAARHGARLVVRFNGGAQAGHNVVADDGRHHTFAQLAAASFDPRVRTHLAAPFVLHPTALLVEAEHLARKGVPDARGRLTVSPEALLITPYHQALNHLRERARGANPHGTCGVGVGETVRLALRLPGLALRARHLGGRDLEDRLRAMRRALYDDAQTIAPQGDMSSACFEDEGLPARWCEAVRPLARNLRGDDEALGPALGRDPAVIFEGAQGVLLDEWHGFHPHTTWSTCTFDNALALLATAGHRGEVTRVGVLRTYSTRHGEGPFPTESRVLTARLAEAHNSHDGWQGRFRAGPLDLVLARYAVAACGGVDGLALTHLDRAAAPWAVCVGYDGADGPRWELDRGVARAIAPCRARDLASQRALGASLERVRPRYAALVGDLGAAIADALGVPLRWTSHGPRRRDKRG